jgi:hypothetical protein
MKHRLRYWPPGACPGRPCAGPGGCFGAAGRSGPCPGPGAPSRSPSPLGVPPPLGPGARGNVMFVFPRRLVVGDVSIIHPAAASFAVGALPTAKGVHCAYPRVCGRCPGRLQGACVSAGVLRPALCADVGRVLRAPWGPGSGGTRGLGRPGCAGWRAWPLAGRLHLGGAPGA